MPRRVSVPSLSFDHFGGKLRNRRIAAAHPFLMIDKERYHLTDILAVFRQRLPRRNKVTHFLLRKADGIPAVAL